MNTEKLSILVVLLLLTVVLMFVMPFYAAVGIFAVLLFGILMIENTARLTLIYVLYMSVHSYVASATGRSAIRLLDNIAPLILLVPIIGGLTIERRLRLRREERVMFLVYLSVLGSLLVARSPAKAALQFITAYTPFIAIYVLGSRWANPGAHIRTFRRALFLLLLVNVGMNAGWRLGINPLPNWFPFPSLDFAIGTFGGCNLMAYFCGMVLFWLLGEVEGGRSARRRLLALFLIAVTLGQLYFTYTNHAYLFIAAAGLAWAILFGKFAKPWFVGAAVVFVVIAVIVWRVSPELQLQINAENMVNRWERLSYSPKLLLMRRLAVENLEKDFRGWLVGYGPGYGVGQLGMNNVSPMALRHVGEFYFAADRGRMDETSITGNIASIILAIWGDLGAIGMTLWALIYFLVLVQTLKEWHSLGRPRDLAPVAYYVVGGGILFVSVNLIFDISLHQGLTGLYWMGVALWKAEVLERTRPKAADGATEAAPPPQRAVTIRPVH